MNLLMVEDLIKRARQHGLVISRFLEKKLWEYFSFIDAVSNVQSNHSDVDMGLLRFERKSMAPEATRMPSYPTGPKKYLQSIQ